MQLVFLRRLYSSAVRLSSAGGSLSLSTCSPSPTLSSAGCLASFFLLLRSLSASFLRFLSDSSPLVVVLVLSRSLSLAFSFSCLFSVIGNAVQGCLTVRFVLVCCLLFLSSGFVSYATGRGVSPVLFVFCESEWVTHIFVSSTLRSVLPSLFSLCFRCFFAVRSSTCFVYCSGIRCLLPCSGFSFSCRSWPLRLSATSPLFLCPVLLCLFHFPWSCLFLWWPALPPPYVSPLGGPYFLSCGCLFFLSLPLAPVCCLLHFLPLSSLRWLCPTLVPGFQFLLVLFCFHFPSVLFSLFVFSPRCLLLLPSWAPLLGVQLPSLLVTCSEVSWPLVDILFGYWLHIFVVFFLLLCFSLCYSTSLLSTFSSLSLCTFLVSV